MNYRIIPVTAFSQNCSLIWCEQTRLAALVDPGGDAEKIKQEVDASCVTLMQNVTLQVLHCPGHTPGHVGFFDEQSQLLISGDVIFKGGVGRSDFPRGDHTQLIDAIKRKLLPLGDDVTFIPGHGPLSTLGYERLHNPFLQDEMPVW